MARCILVADSSRARLFLVDQTSVGLELFESLDHAQSRAKVGDLVADSHGRKPGGHPIAASGSPHTASAHAGRPGAEPDTNPKEVEAQKFARELAGRLELRLNQRTFDELVVVADPHFLGLLRAAVSRNVERHVTAWLHKDFTKLDPREVDRRVHRELRGQV